MAELDPLIGMFELSLRRLDSFGPDKRIIPSDELSQFQDEFSDSDPTDYDPETTTSILPYTRGVAIVRTVISTIAFRDVSEITAEQEQVIRETYRYVNGPLLEVATAIPPESDSILDDAVLRQLREETKRIQARIAETGLIPDTDSHPSTSTRSSHSTESDFRLDIDSSNDVDSGSDSDSEFESGVSSVDG